MLLEELEIPAVHLLSGYLSAVSDFSRRGELKWEFEVRLLRTDARADEIKTLKIYEHAKWKTLKPYVSTVADVETLLGKPVAIYDEVLRTYVAGYQDDPDWTVVIATADRNAELADSVVGRVLTIQMYPKKRVSLLGADFSAFRGATYSGNQETFTSYFDKFGLRYVVHEKDSSDGRFRAGDLKRIDYGPSDVENRPC